MMIDLPVDDPPCLVVLPDGDTCAIGSPDDGDIRLMSLRAGDVVATLSGDEGPVHALALADDGRLLLSAAGDRTIRVWDTATWRPHSVLERPEHVCQLVAGGRVALTSTIRGGDDVRVWDLTTGELRAVLATGRQPTGAMAVSDDGHWAATVPYFRGGATLWNLADGTLTPARHVTRIRLGRRLRPRRVLDVAFGPAGELYTAGDGVTRWDPTTAERTGFLPEPWTFSVAVHPTRPLVAAAAKDSVYLLTPGPSGLADVRLLDTCVWGRELAFASEDLLIARTDDNELFTWPVP